MTAFTTPSTWTAGQSVAAATLNQQVRDNMLHVTEIQAWSPTVTQSVTVARTLNYGRYKQVGKWVWCQCTVSLTAEGTSGQAILVSLPVTASASLPFQHVMGSGKVVDASPFLLYQGAVMLNSTTTVGLIIDAGAGFVGVSPTNWALASGDSLSFEMSYEAA